jgi:DNA-binding XRE family transcriptional regulator
MDRNAEFEKLLKKVAKNNKYHREEQGLTQMDMIEYGFNYRHYQRLESGETGCNLLTLFRLSKAFKIPVSTLLE